MNVNFTIGDKKYVVPERVTCGRFEKAIAWDFEDDKQLKPFVATLLDVPLMDLNLLDDEVFGIITGICITSMDISNTKLHTEINGYKLRNQDEYTFGNLVDIDTYMTMSTTQNICKIASILYNAPESTVSEWTVNEVWSAIVEAGKWRMSVYREYDEFFELSETTKDDQEAAKDANIQLMWYQAILVLADSNFLNIHKVVERPYKEALNFLTWKKAELAKQKLETLKRKNDLSRSIR